MVACRVGDSRHGHAATRVSTPAGPVIMTVPRDRQGVVEPRIVPHRARRRGQIDAVILSLDARGATARDIESHRREVDGMTASRDVISTVTEVVAEETRGGAHSADLARSLRSSRSTGSGCRSETRARGRSRSRT